MKISPTWTAGPLGLLALFPLTASAELFQGPFGPGGTWNIYETVDTATTFKDALDAATASKFDPVSGIVDPIGGTVAGNLVSILSQAENDYIGKNLMPNRNTWIGLTDRVGVAPGAFESQETADNRTLGWAWTTGEAFAYQAWGGGEPNNAGSAEDAAHIRGDGFWNDNASGYGLNEPVEDAQSQAEGAATAFRVVEYRTESATPFAGIKIGSALPEAGTLNAPSGGHGTWGVREVTGLTLAGNLRDTVTQIQSGNGTTHTGQSATLNRTDPQTNGTGGPILSGPTPAFLSNTDGADDNIATAARGRIEVTEAGTYTLQVRSDDGFALRVVGQEFESVNGAGYLDPVDRSTIAFQAGTGDANTRGVITLAAGVYDVEFVHWEGGGGAFYEVTSTKGAVTDPNAAQWLALGDGSTQEARNSNPVRLSGAATVNNVDKPGDNNLATARAAFSGGGTVYTKTVTTVSIPEEQMPIAEQTDPSQRDNYATQIIGKITVDDGNGPTDETLGITFHIASDDGGSLRIVGEDFLRINDFDGAEGHVAVLADDGGDTIMVADYPTGNTNAFGYIELTEGEYDFEIYHSEGGGGSNVNIWYALGDWTEAGWDPAAFRLLTADNILLAANTGLGLVPEPATGLLGLSALGLFAARRRRS